MRTSNAMPAPAEVCSLPPTAAVELRGDDARTFLQGQLTSDLRQLDPQSSQLSAWCNPQGRVITTLRVIDSGESLLLLLPADQALHVAERLQRFVLRAKVRIDAPHRRLPGIGLQGEAARSVLIQAGVQPPSGANGTCSNGGVLLVRLQDPGRERFELYRHDRHFEALAARAVDDGGNAWRAFNIEAGLPVVYAANRERFLPQMLNLERIGAVSFAKGCFAGQEVIARAQNLGRVKRHMERFSVADSASPGDAVFVAGSSVGTVVEAARRGDGGELLAVVPTTRAGAITLDAGGRIRLRDMPVFQ